jgi:hypothetical protein
VLIGLGLLFLLGQLFDFSGWRYLWPFAVITVGALFFAGMAAGGRSAAGLAIPGSIISMVGLMLLVQNLTRNWGSWAYGWTLILVSVGIGIFIMGWQTDDPARRRSGLQLATVGFVLFVIFGSLFELGGLLFGERGAAQIVFPVLLIGLGLFLVIRRSGLWPAALPATPAPAAPVEPPPPPAAPPAPDEAPKQ